MNISINVKELENLLDATPATHNIMLTGRHGIGKSEILSHYFGKQGIPVVALFLGQMSDPGDLIGLPNKDATSGKTVFMPPYWFPMDGKPVVLFLDELNRARPEVLQTIMDLALNRRLAGRDLPPGSRIISAVNVGEEYQLTDLDPALVSRFNIYNFRPTVEEWTLWAAGTGVDERVIEFISGNPSFLDGDGTNNEDANLDKTPDRRGWKRVSDIVAAIEQPTALHKKLISGIIGVQAAAKFCQALAAAHQLTGKDVLLHFDKHKDKLKKLPLHELSQLNESIFRYIETEGTKKRTGKETIAKALADYVELLLGINKSEAFAHWISLYSGGNYPMTTVFVLTDTPKLYKRIHKFITDL